MGIENRVILITGAGSGLGEATAISFAKDGAHVVLCGRDLTKIEAVRKRISAAGGSALAIAADVSSEADVTRLISETHKAYGRLEVVINNAAVFEPGQVIETSLESWNNQLATNLTGVFLIIRACLPLMRAQNYGRIVNITSSLAQNGAGGFAAYSASKAGLESLTRTTAEEEGRYDILVNMYNPGTIRTGMHATGQEPHTAVPELLKLADLPKHGISGKLMEAVKL
ncbi:MAG: short-chain dehydrogenase [Bacilli bacterium]|nr:short-chain dehydrogenase [Bacilli bacterium]